MAKKKKKTEAVSAAVFARRIKTSKQYVYELLKKGTIKKSKDGKIDPVEAMRAIKAARDPARQSKIIPQEETDAGAGGSAAYQAARTASEYFKAKKLKREYEKMLGTILDAADVRREMIELEREVRSCILALPERLAGDLSDEQKEMLEKGLREALEGFGRRLIKPPEAGISNGEEKGVRA